MKRKKEEDFKEASGILAFEEFCWRFDCISESIPDTNHREAFHVPHSTVNQSIWVSNLPSMMVRIVVWIPFFPSSLFSTVHSNDYGFSVNRLGKWFNLYMYILLD